MPSRRDLFNKLWHELQLQSENKPVEIRVDNSMSYNIGQKRNELLYGALGEYIVYIDDDDWVHPNYIDLILKATKKSPDCIGINGIITFNGSNKRKWYISKEYGHWYEQGGVYYRTPNHISPVRRDLALQVGFPNIAFAEDADYSRRLLPLLKTEVLIKEPLYQYIYNSNK